MSDIQTSRRALLGGGLGSALVVLASSEAKASAPTVETPVPAAPELVHEPGRLPTLANSVPYEMWPG